MKKYLLLNIGLLLFLLTAIVNPVQADGIIIPEPPPPCDPIFCPRPISQLVIRYHHVTVKIEDQLAVTHVDQVFYNPNDWVVEGTYIFPIPADAAVSQFILWQDGKPIEGKVLDAQQARQTYEEIVRSLRDPALLEYVGRGAVQASIFPIQPGEERRIELEYSQVLTAENGLVKYVYPLNTEKFSQQPLENVTVRIQVKESQPIRAAYSISHSISVDRNNENSLTASYEESQVTPDKDFAFYYSLGESEAFHLLSYRDPGDPIDPDGFFLLLLAPSPKAASKPVAKDVLLVLDRSGSMEGEKFNQAQSALKYILKHLNSEDRFFLLTFSSNVQLYANKLSSASLAEDAIAWVDRLGAAGSTDINRALLETAAVVDRERPSYLIFLTDGLPTEGVTDSAEILRNFSKTAPTNLRLFPFGVGYDVDTYLLDSLSQEHHGLSTYVQPGQNLEEALSGFYAKISTPVMTDLELDFGSLAAYDLFPEPLPDLFSGSQVMIVGRYRIGGTANVTLSGKVNGVVQTLKFPQQKFATDSRMEMSSQAELPRLWATRKVGYLLNKIRLNGADQETVDQIVRLSIRYGIVTPYTSYLVTEPMPLGVENQQRVAEEALKDYQAEPTMVAGAGAVNKAAEQGAMSQAEVPQSVSDLTGQNIRTVGSRTFVFVEGKWMDTTFDPQTANPQQVAFLSPEYFKLAETRPDVAAALALGERVIILIDGKAYEIVSSDSQTSQVELPESVSPTATLPAQGDSVQPTPITGNKPLDEKTQPEKSSGCPGVFLPIAGMLIALVVKKR